MTANRSIVHIEIPAADREVSAKFYSELFGWQLEHLSEPVPYTAGQSGNVGIGLPNMGESFKTGDVTVYIASDDLDADLKKIEAAGGKTVMLPEEVPGMGWFAWFSDPAGNRLALWKAAMPQSQ